MKTFSDIGVQIPQVYLPKRGVNLTKWAVLACDPLASEPEYWREAENLVGDAPSALKLTFSEAYLADGHEAERVERIHAAMQKYLDEEIIAPREGIIYVERNIAGNIRNGILLCLDLERYDYHKDSRGLIRATEGIIAERLVSRIRVRENAPLELSHILVLIDDPNLTVIEPLEAAKSQFEKLYDFDLMLNSGHLTGCVVNAEYENKIIAALRELAKPEIFSKKYNADDNKPVLLFAAGDGNHSLATAKAIWEKIKSQVGMNHPARYALVEVENIHDKSLNFEPIHRVLFNLKKDWLAALKSYFGANFSYAEVADANEMIQRVDSAEEGKHVVGLICGEKFGAAEIANPTSNLAVGDVQPFLDDFIKNGGAEKIDYIHGAKTLTRLASEPNNAGFYLAGIHKSELFKTVIFDGALPRKTFSMGAANEKRFYMEARKITLNV